MWIYLGIFLSVAVGAWAALSYTDEGKKIKYKIMISIFSKCAGPMAAKMLDMLSKKTSDESNVQKAVCTGHSLEIPFIYMGKEYVVYVPYNRRTDRGDVLATNINGEEYLVNYCPGVPLLVDHSQIKGVKKIYRTDISN